MKRASQIVLITSLVLLLLRIIPDQLYINFSQNIYSIVWNIFILIELVVVFFALKRIYLNFDYQVSYLKLLSFALIIVILKYILCFIYEVIVSKYFPSLDPSIKLYETLHIPYREPVFAPFQNLIINPFQQTYNYIVPFPQYYTALTFIFTQGIFYSLFLTFLVKKFYEKQVIENNK